MYATTQHSTAESATTSQNQNYDKIGRGTKTAYVTLNHTTGTSQVHTVCTYIVILIFPITITYVADSVHIVVCSFYRVGLALIHIVKMEKIRLKQGKQ